MPFWVQAHASGDLFSREFCLIGLDHLCSKGVFMSCHVVLLLQRNRGSSWWDVRSGANLKSISDAIELLGLEDASLVETPSF